MGSGFGAGKREGKKYNCEYVESYEKILDNISIDGVLITSPGMEHYGQMVKAIQAGKHIFVEKPAFISIEEAHQIRDMVKDSGISFVVSDPIRTSKRQLLCAKSLMNSGRLGEITMVRVRCAMPNALHYSHLDSFDPKLTGGGIMLDLGCHAVHMLNILLGKPEKVHGAFGGMSVAAAEYGVEDNAIGVYEFGGGVLGIAETSALAERREDFFLVSGTEGSIVCLDREIRFREAEGDWVTIPPDTWPEEGVYPLYGWIDSIWDRASILEGGIEDAVTYTEMICSVYEAAKQYIKII